MFKRISIFLITLLAILAFTIGAGAVDPGLFIVKDADNTYIKYVDAEGTSIMTIDDTDGVTIANSIIANTYTSMTLTAITDAESLTTGSFTTVGGASITKQLYIGDDIDMSVSASGTYDLTLKDSVADALSIVGGTTDMIVFCTDTDAVTITPPVTITGAITCDSATESSGTTSGSVQTDGGVGIAKKLYVGGAADFASTVQIDGAVTVSASGGGVDVKIYGNTAAYFVWFDANGDTNGAVYFGANTKGILTTLYGDTTGCGVFWDPSTDTNGTLSIGATGGSKGVDCVMYGTTSGKYWKWDRSADAVALVGNFSQTGTLAIVGAITSTPAAAGTFLDFVLETEWVSGTLINADFGGATTLDDDAIGMELDFNANITMTTDKNVTGHVVNLPALTQTAANTTLITGFDITTAGALVQNTEAGTITWKGLDVQLPNTTQTTGTVNSYGVYIAPGTVTSGTQVGLYIGSTLTTGIDINDCSVGIDFSGACTTAAISMDGATFANVDHEIEMRNTVTGDKTVICSGAASDDAGIVTAVGADDAIADGSLYMSVVDGAGSLFIKKNDVWVAFSNP